MSAPAVTQQTVVVTHLYKSDPSTPATNFATVPHNAYAEKFLEGEPKALGVTQILIGLVNITFAIPVVRNLRSVAGSLGSPFVIGIAFIISGAVSIAAEKNPHIRLLRACLVTNIISSFLAAIGAIIYIIDIVMMPSCTSSATYCDQVRQLYTASYYTFVVLLVFTLLEFTVTIVVSVFVCKSTRCCHPYSSMPTILLDASMTEEE